MPSILRRHPLLFPVLTTAVVVVGVVVRYQRADAFDRFAHLQLLPMVGILLAVGVRWLAPTLKFHLITRRWERPLTFRQCFTMQLVGSCGAAITPAASGSTPTYLWYMWRLSIPAATATALMAYIVVLDAMLFSVTVPLLLPWYLGLLGADAPRGIVWTTLNLSILSFAFAVVLLWRPAWITYLCSLALKPFPKLWAKISSVLHEAADAVVELRRAGLVFHSLCIVLNTVEWIATFTILPLAAFALGFEPRVLDLILIQDIMQVVAFFFPTPGGSGWFEGVVPLAAASAWPADAAAPLILLWRFFSYWIYLILTVLLGTSMISQALERRGRRQEDMAGEAAHESQEKKQGKAATEMRSEETTHADG